MKSYKCCISSVEIVSPSIDEMIKHNAERFKEFIPTFLNTMGQVALQHGCEMVRGLGADGLQFSFPQTSNLTDAGVITNVLECFLEQLEIRQSLSFDMGGQEVQEISCRIIADYGTLTISEPGDDVDLGPNISSIDRISWKMPAQANTIIVGDEFYKVIESFPPLHQRYLFESKGDCVINNAPYPVYHLARRSRNQIDLSSKNEQI